jgi:hypothetical protein
MTAWELVHDRYDPSSGDCAPFDGGLLAGAARLD